jgi:hypothetical protein
MEHNDKLRDKWGKALKPRQTSLNQATTFTNLVKHMQRNEEVLSTLYHFFFFNLPFNLQCSSQSFNLVNVPTNLVIYH